TEAINIELDSPIKTYPVRLKLAGLSPTTSDDSVHIRLLQDDEIFEFLPVETERLNDDEFRLSRLAAGDFEIWIHVGPNNYDPPQLSGFMRAVIQDSPEPEIDLGIITLRKSIPVDAHIPTTGYLGPTTGYLGTPVNLMVRAEPIEGPFAFLQSWAG